MMEQFAGLKHYLLVNVPGKQPPTFHYKSNVKIFCPKFTLLEQLLIYSINFLCCSKRTCVTSLYNNEKISKARFLSSSLQNSYIVTELHALTNRIARFNQLHYEDLVLDENCEIA